MIDVVVGTLLILLSLSFFYKSAIAVFYGKVHYWSGFLPISILSPLFVHLTPESNRSLIRTASSFWFHLIMGPVFFGIALVLLTNGMDRAGLPGTPVLNEILTLGKADALPAITYSKSDGYAFPVWFRAKTTIYKLFSTKFNPEVQQEVEEHAIHKH